MLEYEDFNGSSITLLTPIITSENVTNKDSDGEEVVCPELTIFRKYYVTLASFVKTQINNSHG